MKIPSCSLLIDRAVQASPEAIDTVIVGHRGGGGDFFSKRALTRGTDWSGLGRRPDHYDYREEWANRLKTFERMWEKGVREFELDVLPSKSSTPTVIHNSVIDGKNVALWSDAELASKGSLPLKSLLDSVERFPGFADERARLFVELKGSHSAEELSDAGENGVAPASRKLVEDVVALVTQRVQSGKWSYEQLPIIGFNHGMLRLAKQLNPDIQVATSFGKENFGLAEEQMAGVRARPDFDTFIHQMLTQAKETGAFAINPDSRLVTERLVAAAHQHGLQVNAWTAFRVPEATRELLDWNVDTLITDTPLRAARTQLTMDLEKFLKAGPPTRPPNAVFLGAGVVGGTAATITALGLSEEEHAQPGHGAPGEHAEQAELTPEQLIVAEPSTLTSHE